jgi:putative CocE/NonD family hydrolase
MRDGTILRADVVWPVPRAGTSGRDERFPVLLTRTPYQKQAETVLASYGYITVSQDVRGRYASEGEYHSIHERGGAAADFPDGHDTVLWAAALDGSSGRVGAFGTSYPAWEAWALASTRPAPLGAMCVSGMSQTSTAVEAIPRPGRRLQWFFYTAAPDARRQLGLPGPQTREDAQQLWHYERHKWLWFLPWSELPEHVLGPLTGEFKRYLQHATEDTFGLAGIHHLIEVPILHRTGWYDRFVSTIDHFTAMQRGAGTAAARRSQRLLVGPWGHTGAPARKVGQLDFGPEADLAGPQLMLRWFDYWLKGIDTGVLDDPPVRYFLMGQNVWRSADAWPPPAAGEQRWYLRSGGRANTAAGDGRLSRRPPAQGEAGADRYRYDPRDPVPTIWPLNDQNEPLDHRPLNWRHDLLVYVSEPLTEELLVAGDPTVELYATSSARDTDFVARLADVRPDGFVQPLCYGIVRARYRQGFETPIPLTPGETVRYTIGLHPVAFAVLPGHRLRLEVTSSDFPNFDRNHNTGGDDFSDPTLIVAHQTIHHAPQDASCVRLPVLSHPAAATAATTVTPG